MANSMKKVLEGRAKQLGLKGKDLRGFVNGTVKDIEGKKGGRRKRV